MKTKKCVSALLLSILMILSLVPTASATESGTATVITENEKAIITVDGTVIEIPVDDSTCEYIAETSVVNDAGVDWVRVDLYSVDENGTRAAIGFATYSWFVSNRTGGMDGYYTLAFHWDATLLLDKIYVTDYCLTTPTGKVVASGSPDIPARGTARGNHTVGTYWSDAGVETMYMDTTSIEGFPMDESYRSLFTVPVRQVIDVN